MVCFLPFRPPVEPALFPPGSFSVCQWEHLGFPEHAPHAPWPPALSGSPYGTPPWFYPAVDRVGYAFTV